MPTTIPVPTLRRTLVLLFVLGAATLTACIPFARVYTTPALEGVVLSAEDGLPVAYATVAAPDFDLSGTTDEHGRFEIEPASERRWLVMVLPGSTVDEFEIRAWHGDGGHGEAHTRATSISSSLGRGGMDLLLVMVHPDEPVTPALAACEDELSFPEAQTARLAHRMEALLANDTFREAYTRDRRWRFEEAIRQDLRSALRTCGLSADEDGGLLEASYQRQYAVEGGALNGELEARARAAGLSPAQTARVAAFGFPVLVPTSTEGLELVEFRVAEAPIGDDFTGGSFDLHYRSVDGTCVWVTGANDGLGGGRWEDAGLPPVSVPGLGREVRILEDRHVPPDEDGGTSLHLGTSWLDLGRGEMHAAVQSRDDLIEGCRTMDADALAAFVASLRPVDPGDDARFGG